MIQFLVNIADFMRPLLFVVLLLYLPLKTGFLFDVLIKPLPHKEIRFSRQELFNRLVVNGVMDIVLLPFRLLLIGYISFWLVIDRHFWWWVFAFILTLIPVVTF